MTEVLFRTTVSMITQYLSVKMEQKGERKMKNESTGKGKKKQEKQNEREERVAFPNHYTLNSDIPYKSPIQ